MLKLTILISLTLFCSTLQADKEEAKELFNEAKCLECHEFNHFKARKEKINSLKKLHQTVDKCAYNNDVGWFDDEVKDVVLYLNSDYYHFKNLSFE